VNCVFLKACPGSGKTEVVGLKAAYEMSKWLKTPGGIAVLTFTNNAAEVIEKRVNQFSGVANVGYPHFIGTVDSWLHGYVAHPFAHMITKYNGKSENRSIRVIDNHSKANFLTAFKTKYSLAQTGNPAASEYYFDAENGKYVFASANRKIDSKRNLENLEDWQIADLKRTKDRFKRAGFATYQDIEHICYELLSEKPEIARIISLRFPFIIVDECQDLSWIQMQILDRMRLHGTALHFIGDLNQAIYEFKKVDPEKVAEYTNEQKFDILSLSKNYRNCQLIANLCDNIVDNICKATPVDSNELESPCICLTFKEDEMMRLPAWFSDYLDRFGIDKKYSTIVTRSWANVSRMRPAGNGQINNYQKRLAMAICLWKTGSRQATGDSLKFFGRFISEKFFPGDSTDSREYYRPESVDSSLQWRLFLAKALDECSQDEILCNLEQSWKTWAQAVRERLHKHLTEIAGNIGEVISDCGFPQLVAKKKNDKSSPLFSALSDGQVSGELPSTPSVQESLRITTIHNVKGETLEALMLVSSRNKIGTDDGYWTQWLDNSTSEASRLAYVASSRPKKLIIWAIPTPSSNESCYVERLKTIGFEIMSMNPKAQKNLESWLHQSRVI